MITEWTIDVSYGNKDYQLKAQLIYHSSQIMRISIKGNKRVILLENDYPSTLSKAKKGGVKWKIKEGNFDAGTPQNARLLMDIFKELEMIFKREYPV